MNGKAPALLQEFARTKKLFNPADRFKQNMNKAVENARRKETPR